MLSPQKWGRLRDESLLKDKRSSSQTQVSAYWAGRWLRAGPREAALIGEQLKQVFVSQGNSVGQCFLPAFLTQVRRWLSLALAQHVQELLCMPVRVLLPQIGTRSQMRDRCSRQPVEREQRFRLLITASWVVEPFFRFQMIKLFPRCQFKIRVALRSAQPNRDALIYLSLLKELTRTANFLNLCSQTQKHCWIWNAVDISFKSITITRTSARLGWKFCRCFENCGSAAGCSLWWRLQRAVIRTSVQPMILQIIRLDEFA